MSSKKPKKYKLLLDEGLYLPKSYPRSNQYHDLKHVALTKHRSKPDEEIFEIAKRENRLPIVFNTKDFKPLIKNDRPSVISLSSNLFTKEADLKIIKALKQISENQTKGHLISITKSGISIMKQLNLDN